MLTYEDPARGEGGDTAPDTPSYIRTTTRDTLVVSQSSDGDVIVADSVDSTNGTIGCYSSGRYLISISGEYVANITLNADVSGSGSALEFWAEVSTDGDTWELASTSGEYKEVASRSEGSVKISTTLTVRTPVYYRLKVRRTKSAALELSSYTLSNGVISPAAVVAVARVSGS